MISPCHTTLSRRPDEMLGWMILFALMAILAPIMAFAGSRDLLAPQMGGLLFALLFFLGLITRLVRGRAY